jgi:hypothetical protein
LNNWSIAASHNTAYLRGLRLRSSTASRSIIFEEIDPAILALARYGGCTLTSAAARH